MKDLIIWILLISVGFAIGFEIGSKQKIVKETPLWYIEKITTYLPPPLTMKKTKK